MDQRTLGFAKRVDELAFSAIFESYNEALRQNYLKKSKELSPDDYAFLYTLIEEEVSGEELTAALLALRRKKEKLTWITSRDGIVCSDCDVLDGTEFDIKETEGLIPLHPNCRCVWYPSWLL